MMQKVKDKSKDKKILSQSTITGRINHMLKMDLIKFPQPAPLRIKQFVSRIDLTKDYERKNNDYCQDKDKELYVNRQEEARKSSLCIKKNG